jgi:hypothetical protein
MDLDVPFVIIESAPRKRGKTTFNIELLPKIEHEFEHIYIFCPSIAFKDEYYTQFHKNPKYTLYSKNLHTKLEAVIDKQKKKVERAAQERRRVEDKKRKIDFTPARTNGKKRRTSKTGHFTEYSMPEFHITIPPRMEKYSFLLPDPFWPGKEGKIKKREEKETKTIDTAGPQILIVLDDCIGEGLFDGQGPAQELAARGRHFNTSLIASTQHLTRVDIIIRNNADNFLFWNPHSVQELESFIEKFVSQNYRRRVREKISESYKGEHDFIFYNPHALQWVDRFTVGDKDDFFNNRMRRVFEDNPQTWKSYFYSSETAPIKT